MWHREKNTLRLGNLKVRASRWPWQGYGWKATGGPTAPLNSSGARFGAGWRYKLGVAIGGTTLHVDLLFGMLSFQWETAKDRAAQARYEADAAERRRKWAAEASEHEAEVARIRAGRAGSTPAYAVGSDIPF